MLTSRPGVEKRSSSRLCKPRLFEDLGYEPHPGQAEVHASRAPRRVVACGVRWGKTVCAAMEGVAAALEPAEQSVGWVVAPTYDLADRVFREIERVCVNKLRHRIVLHRNHERRIDLRNLAGGISEIRAKSADNPVSLLGAGLDWLIVDEASRLRPSIWQSHLSQRLIDKNGWALLISTPKGKGYFYDLFRRGKGRDEQFESWNYPSWTNPLLDRAKIEEERARLPERVYLQEYSASFVDGAGAVYRRVRENATGEWREPEEGMKYFAGLDLAKIEDYTVLVILDRECRVVFADRFHRIDWSLQVERILAATSKYNRALTWTDTTGAGEPVYEALRKAGVRAQPYRFSAASKSALVDNLALLLEKDQITLPRPELWPDGIDELEAFEYAISETGNVRSGAPAGSHDDAVMALGLAAWGWREGRGVIRFFRSNTLQLHGRSDICPRDRRE